MFGDPGDFAAPRPVPTLRYLWTVAAVPEETIIHSPSQPGVLRTIVVQSGVESPLAWVSERRDLEADYQASFGSLPATHARAVELFPAHDQTPHPVLAHYAPAPLLSSAASTP